MRSQAGRNGAEAGTGKHYRRFLTGVFVYSVTDALRGMPDAHRLTVPQTADTAVHSAVLTAHAFAEDVRRSMQAGLNAHLFKPVDAGKPHRRRNRGRVKTIFPPRSPYS